MDNLTSEQLKEKLIRALKAKAVLAERSKRLEQQLEDFRKREDMMHHFASELLERQRELNFMLHRANSVLHQLQETNLALSAEFTELVKELPPAKDPEIEDHIAKVNELFRKTHELAGKMQEEIFQKTSQETSTPLVFFEKQPEVLSETVDIEKDSTSIAEQKQFISTEIKPSLEEKTDVENTSQGSEETEKTKTITKDNDALSKSILTETERLNQLFDKIENNADSSSATSENSDSKASKKPSFLARIFGLTD